MNDTLNAGEARLFDRYRSPFEARSIRLEDPHVPTRSSRFSPRPGSAGWRRVDRRPRAPPPRARACS